MISRAHHQAEAELLDRTFGRPASRAPSSAVLPIVLIGSLAIHGVAALILLVLPRVGAIEDLSVAVDMTFSELPRASEPEPAPPEPAAIPIPEPETRRVRVRVARAPEPTPTPTPVPQPEPAAPASTAEPIAAAPAGGTSLTAEGGMDVGASSTGTGGGFGSGTGTSRGPAQPRIAPPEPSGPSAEEIRAARRRYVQSVESLIRGRVQYPRVARRLGHQGRVELVLRVARDGRIVAVSVAQSSGHSELDEAALNAARALALPPPPRVVPWRATEDVRAPVSYVLR